MSEAAAVDEFLATLAGERREFVADLRRVILEHLPPGYEEQVLYGMLSYVVPLERYPDTYNGQPLTYVALASQKNHVSLHLYSVYMDPEQEATFVEAFTAAAGRKPNMGKSCVRFKALNDVPDDVIAATVAATSVDDFIAMYERARSR